VSHYYSFLKNGIISTQPPETVIVSGYDINSFSCDNNGILEEWVSLLRTNYIPIITESLSYQISSKYLKWTVDNASSLHYGLWCKETLIGTISSKEINIQIIDTIIPIRYVDYLCIDSKHRSKNLASVLISHMANKYPGGCFIFKKEIYPLPYRHLVSYDTYMLSLDSINYKHNLPFKIHRLSRESNDNEILDCFSFYQQNSSKFHLFQKYTLKEFVYNFIYSDSVFTYYILDNTVIKSIVVYFNSQFTYQNKKILELFLYLKDDTMIDLSLYLKNILYDLRVEKYYYVYISDIGDNKEILDSFENNRLDKYCNTTYLHLYNYHHTTIAKEKILLSFF
jgi:hypothetical protein